MHPMNDELRTELARIRATRSKGWDDPTIPTIDWLKLTDAEWDELFEDEEQQFAPARATFRRPDTAWTREDRFLLDNPGPDWRSKPSLTHLRAKALPYQRSVGILLAVWIWAWTAKQIVTRKWKRFRWNRRNPR